LCKKTLLLYCVKKLYYFITLITLATTLLRVIQFITLITLATTLLRFIQFITLITLATTLLLYCKTILCKKTILLYYYKNLSY